MPAVRRIRPAAFEDELTLVEHLDELRARLIVCVAVFGVALALCFWQNHLVLRIFTAPLPPGHERLTTFGVTEPFTTTMTVSAYAAIVLALPFVLYELYAYVLPAFSRRQRRLIVPLLAMIPVLFVAGVAFGYFLVLPAAARFLLNFNDAQFNVQLQAKQYYGFFAMTLLASGIVFQVPVGILAVTRLGILKVAQLTQNRRYAYLLCAVVAAALPGVDPISMLLEMAPLVVLYELSIVLAKAFGMPGERWEGVTEAR